MRRGGRISSRSDKTIATRVKMLMEARQLDQKDLAKSLGLSEGYISRILSGERPWPISLIFKVADVFGEPVQDIDPDLQGSLLQELLNLELRRDVPQLRVLHAFVRCLPRTRNPHDLEALIRVLDAFAEKEDED